MKSLWGDTISDVPLRKHADKAHAAAPGTGPAGETCKTCKHYYRAHYHDRTWLKCGLMQHHWTHGPGTDIKARDPACKLWEKDA